MIKKILFDIVNKMLYKSKKINQCEDSCCEYPDDNHNHNNNDNNDNEFLEDIIMSMTFLINSKGQLYINADWINESSEIAEIFGAFLYVLNNGDLKHNVLQYFDNLRQSDDLQFANFINNIIKKWDELVSNSDEPIIQPTKAFSINKSRLAITEGDDDE